MWWIAVWGVVTVIGGLAVIATTNSVRFRQRVDNEVRQAWAAKASPGQFDLGCVQGLPAPVKRYLTKALGARRHAVSTARLQQVGTFRTSLDGGWLPIQAQQYFRADPPGFIWWGRVRLAPGFWIDARDRSVAGIGHMLVRAESTATIADAKGPELDQSAMLRLLGELAWVPTAFLDERFVRWSPLDDRRAGATLSVNGRAVSGTFQFGDDDLPAVFLADRYRDVGGGKAVLTPFTGELSDYRELDGMLVPHRVVGSWNVDGAPVPFVRLDVRRIEFDTWEPFR